MVGVGIDVGGTFTDVVVFDEDSGEIRACKVPTTRENQAIGVINGLERIRIEPGRVNRIVHGMTVGTNAILERDGARLCLITTRGFKDLIEIGRTQRNAPGSLFQIKFERAKPLVPRPNRFEINERVGYDGRVIKEVSPEEVARISEQIKRCEAEVVVICYLHSYRNPSNERMTEKLLTKNLPDTFISCSAEVIAEYREYERFSTTVLNGYLMPVMDRYLKFLEQKLRACRYPSTLFIMASNGGVCTVSQARTHPVRTILSGPVGGVNGAVFLGENLGLKQMITYDMGGTSTDVSLVENFKPKMSADNIVQGFPVKMPQVEINTVGAGGGSIARMDVAGVLSVGPKSAGADPGPACYQKGGKEVTVTDANLFLNRLGEETVLGGQIRLSKNLARSALLDLSRRLGGMDIHRLSEGIIQIAVAKMVGSIREITIEKGKDPRDFVLVPFGGAGPMHAVAIARELQIHRILIPKYAGNLSALGLLASDPKLDLVRTHLTLLRDLGLKALREICRELKSEGEQVLLKEGFRQNDLVSQFAVDLRYFGQAFELTVAYQPDMDTVEDLNRRFYRCYREAYGHGKADGELQLINIRARVGAGVSKPRLRREVSSKKQSSTMSPPEFREVYFDGQAVTTPIYRRDTLKAGDRIEGPAIVEEDGSTTVIFAGWEARVDALANLIIENQAHQPHIPAFVGDDS